MPLLHAITLLLVTAFPSKSMTSWMRPESFRLTIGMSRTEAVRTLEDSGWKPKKGKDANQLVVDYSDGRAVRLDFRAGTLKSLRFELFTVLPEIRSAYDEHRAFLVKTFGAPKPTIKSKSIVIYDAKVPNVMMVVSDDPKSVNGKKGVGLLVVRYFEPEAQ